MQYRKLGKTGLDVSILGYGCMRLPTHSEGGVNESDAIRCIRRAIDGGVNFVDTAYIYHGGASETALGKALKDGYREKVYLVDKSPTWLVEKPEDYDKLLDEQLRRLDTDYLDIYLFHSLGENSFKDKVRGFDLYDRALRAKEEGKIRFIGWSFHDKPENLKPIIDAGIGDVMLVQYNMLDRRNEEMIAYAADNGIGVMVMSPVGGGRLVSPPSEVAEAMRSEGRKPFRPELALRFVWSNPNVSIALSGMSSMRQVEDNIDFAGGFAPFEGRDFAEVDEALEQYKSLTDLYCTGCDYCMPCPEGVNIPLNFDLMNYFKVFHAYGYAKNSYNLIGVLDFLPGKRASECTECGDCEPKCPQDIPIIAQLKETAD
ncbi:MAG: aldo/keto reductase, partial [bacterium]|nr:aldo/keto reductase [bacterium]